MTLEEQCDAAMARIRERINRSAGQHWWAWRRMWL